MWIVFGTKAQLTRVPNGLKVERRCGQCGETATFYEKQATKTFRLYFIDVFDYEKHRVMACGCCGAYYATDELGAPPPIGEQLGQAVDRMGGYVSAPRRPWATGSPTFFSADRGHQPPPPAPYQKRERERDTDLDKDMDLGSGVGRVDDDMEARFRDLEEKARKGDQG